jgi:outer membrane protein assembly factor BamD
MSFALSGCAVKNTKKKILPSDVYYKKALYYAHERNYNMAAKNFKSLITNYPSYSNTKKAELKLADVYYLGGKYIEAEAAYHYFIMIHPRSKHIPYALFYNGMSYYKQIESIGRNQKPIKKAKLEFEKLISKFPYSKYSKKAFKLIRLINIHLSENTFFTGLYYFNAGMWKQAAYMYKVVLNKYQGLPIIPKTLYYIIVCYKNLNNKKMEQRYKEFLLSHYPSSVYTKRVS